MTLVGGTAGDPVGMAGSVSPAAQLEESRPAGGRLSGLLGTPNACRGLSGPMGGSSAAGAASTFCIRAVAGSRSGCFGRSCEHGLGVVSRAIGGGSGG